MDCPKNGEDLGDGFFWWCDEGCDLCGGTGNVDPIRFMKFVYQRQIERKFLR